jgi:hypothetical protein
MRSLGSDYGLSMTILLAECVLIGATTGIDSVFTGAPSLSIRRGGSHRPGGAGQ